MHLPYNEKPQVTALEAHRQHPVGRRQLDPRLAPGDPSAEAAAADGVGSSSPRARPPDRCDTRSIA